MPGVIASVRHLIGDFVLKPAARLLDVSVALATTPRKFAQRHIHLGDRRSFREALTFYVTAASVAIVLNRTAFYLLGATTFSELNYWILALVLSLIHLSVITVPLSVGRQFQFFNLLHIFLFTSGAGGLVGAVLFITSTLTVYALRVVGYIPDYVLDLNSLDNFVASAVKAYQQCLIRESVVARLVLNSDNAIGALAPPIQYLPLLTLLPAAVYLISFIVTVATLLKRSLLFVSAVSIASAALLVGGFIFGLRAHDRYMEENSKCVDESVQVAKARTFANALQLAVNNNFRLLIGKKGPQGQVKDVIVEGKSVLVYLEMLTDDADTHRSMMDSLRKTAIGLYCGSDGPPWKFFRESGVSLVHIFRLPEGGHIGTVAVSRDECRT